MIAVVTILLAFPLGFFLPVSYALVTALIFTAGFGLVALGHWVASRRRSRQHDAVSA